MPHPSGGAVFVLSRAAARFVLFVKKIAWGFTFLPFYDIIIIERTRHTASCRACYKNKKEILK